MLRTDRGRTYDRSQPNRSKRQKSACHGGPSTYDDLRADLGQLLLEARQRPIFCRLGRCQRAQKVAEIVSECVKLKTPIFTCYLELGSMGALIAELDRQGIRTKVNDRRDGDRSGAPASASDRLPICSKTGSTFGRSVVEVRGMLDERLRDCKDTPARLESKGRL
jgi:hypothetical protein